MKYPFSYRKSIVMFALSACVFVDGYAATTPDKMKASQKPGAAKVEKYDFSAPKLDTEWKWIRENPKKWKLDPSKKMLIITTEAGNLYRDENDQKNILLRKTDYSDFQIDTKVHIRPVANYQQCGLIVYDDDDNYVKLVRLFYNGQQIELGSEHDGSYIQKFSACGKTDVYIRLTKINNIYTGYFSFDGKKYFSVGSYENDLGNHLMAGITGSNSSRIEKDCLAKFEYFKITNLKASVKTGE